MPEPSYREIFVAVGYALTCWEQMELQLAGLYTILKGDDYSIHEIVKFGANNSIFNQRLKAISSAFEDYSKRHHDQDIEGKIIALIGRADDLCLERHRIAHGHLVVTHATDIGEENRVTVHRDRPIYWLGAPFYSVNKLKWGLIGMQAHVIRRHADAFLTLRDDVEALNRRLSSVEPPAGFSPLPFLLEVAGGEESPRA